MRRRVVGGGGRGLKNFVWDMKKRYERIRTGAGVVNIKERI
jgi:hypothetical protein